MRTASTRGSTNLALLFALSGALWGNPGPDLYEKGENVSALLREDSLQRAELSRRQDRVGELRTAMARAMRLNAYADDCVAYDPGPAACLLTVEEFNLALENREIPVRETDPDFPLPADVEAARGEALMEILEDRYFTAAPMPARIRDSLSGLAEAALHERDQAFRARLGDSALRAAYRAHFQTAFRGGEEITYAVLASSDSVRLDSLRTAFDTAGVRIRRAVPAGELPAEALRAVRGVEPGALAGPVRVPYGYLYLREASRRKLPDVTMEAALPVLLSLLNRPPEIDLGREREMEAYYREHGREFSKPDTLRFLAWLLPEARRMSLSRRLEMAQMRTDTATTRSLPVQEKDLPPRLRQDLANYLPCREGEMLGPIRSVFGTWYLKVLEVRAGGRPLSLDESRPAIRKLLFGWDGTDPVAPALAEAKAKEKDIRKAVAAQHLMAQETSDKTGGGEDGARAAGPAAGKAESGAPWERTRSEWMRKYLVIRFVALPEPGLDGRVPGKPARENPGVRSE